MRMGKQNKNVALVLTLFFRSGCYTEQGESCLDFSIELFAGFDLKS